MKRLFALLLALAMVITCLPTAAFAATVTDSGSCGDNVTWSLTDDGVLTISGTGAMTDYEDPSETPWFYYTLTAIVIEDGVTAIGANAFRECTAVTKLSIADSVTNLGEAAFCYCEGLTEVVLPAGLTSLSTDLFAWCTSLETVHFPAGLLEIQDGVFNGCEKLTDVELPDTLTSIDFGAFAGCNSLTQITLPASCQFVGAGAFQNCLGLTSVTYAGSAGTIDGSAFEGCSALTEITFQGDAPTIGDNVFYGVTATVRYPENKSGWDTAANQNYGGTLTWEAYTMGVGGDENEIACGDCGDNVRWSLSTDGVLTISGQGAMYDYPNGFVDAPWGSYRMDITGIVIGDEVTYVGIMAFEGCEGGVSSITIGSSVAAIGESAFFAACNGVTQLTIPASCTTIGDKAFYGCASLATLVISGDNVTIGSQAFANGAFDSTMRIVFEGDAGSIDATAFEYVTAEVLYPVDYASWSSVANQNYGGTLTWEAYTMGVGGDENEIACGDCGDNLTWVLDENGVLTISGTGAMTDYAGGEAPWCAYENSAIQSVVVEEGVTRIGNYAFHGRMSLASVQLPSTLVSIGDCAFGMCYALESIDLPEGLVSIGIGAFEDCSKLTSLTIPSTVTVLAEMAFNFCSGLTEITFLGDAPIIDDLSFQGVTATAFYPYGNATWDTAKDQNYGGTLTWQSYITEEEAAASGQCGDNVTWTLDGSGVMTISGTGAMWDNEDGTAYWLTENADAITSVVIEEGVTHVGNMAFIENANVTSVSLPSTLESIGAGAFNRCAIPNVTIPASVTSIGAHAFFWQGCSMDIVVEGNPTIENSAFGTCYLNSITFMGDAPTFGEEAFFNSTATVYYPAGNTTWDGIVGNNYSGTLTWVAYTPGVCGGHVAGTVNGFDACVNADGDLHICANNFPDDNFRNYVSSFDTDGDGYLSATELAAVQTIECVEIGITTIEGVEFFNELLSLNVDSNEIGSVDLSGNTKLEYLNLRNNNLTGVDVTMLTELVEVLFCMNQLTSLDLSQNTKLEQLSFPENQLTSIDLSGNPNIWWLVCYMNELTTLDVTGLANLTWLDCDENNLTTLDVSKNTALETLMCAGNQLGSLDITANTKLQELHAANCGLTSLDITQNADLLNLRINNNHGISVTGINDPCHEDLLCLDYGNCQITIDHSKMTSLQVLQCYANDLTTIDVSMLPDLVELTCSENQLKVLDLSGNPNLERLHCRNNYLVELDISNNPNITTLYCNNQYYDGTFPTVTTNANGEYEIDLSNLVANYGNITDVENADGTASSYDPTTGIATFFNDPSTTTGFWYYYTIGFAADPSYTMKVGVGDVPHEEGDGVEGGGSGDSGEEADPFVPSADCTDSTSDLLHICEYNFPDANFRGYVSSFDNDGDGYLSRSEAAVHEMDCSNLEIADLTGIEHFTRLVALYCYSNNLTSLDVSANTKLEVLHLQENGLTSLDVSMLPALMSLVYNNNNVGFVDLTNNPNINDLHNIGTGISTLDVSMLPGLERLYCADNELTSLDLSGNPNLKELGCNDNKSLSSLTLAAGTDLVHLDYSNTSLTFDITTMPNLEVLRCSGMGLTAIDFSANTALRELSLNDNKLTAIDVSMLPNLEVLDIMVNRVTSLDLSNNPKIRQLYASENCLPELDLSGFTVLEDVYAEVQFCTTGITWTQVNDLYQVDMSQFVDNIANIVRVDNAENFDNATGIATFSGQPTEVIYIYNTSWNGMEMQVIVSESCFHSWNVTDCTTQICTWCGATETGDFHEWQAATCQAPETCSVCGATNGTVSGHSYGAWVTTTVPTTEATGERTRTCAWCGDTQTQSIDKLADDSDVVLDNITDASNNDLDATATVTYDAIADGESAGDYVAVELTVDEVNPEDIDYSTMEQLEEQANFIVNGLDQSFSDTGAVFMDINLYKQVGTNAAQTVTETNQPVTVTITVPQQLQASSMLYYIIRVHDGVAEVLPCTYDAATGTLTFETDCFSNYTLFWVQTEETGGEEGGEETEFVDLELGEQTHGIADEQILYFQWVAPQEGELVLNMLSDSWLYAAAVEHADGTTEETPEYSSTDESPVPGISLHVYEGSTVLIAMTTADLTAGELTFYAEFGLPAESFVAQIGDVQYPSLAEALAAAVSGDTIELIADTRETLVYIAPGVTLDLNACTLEATYVLGLNGSKLMGNRYNSSSGTGKLVVAKDNLALPSDASTTVLPVWMDGYYAFMTSQLTSLKASAADGTMSLTFYANASSTMLPLFKQNGVDDYGLSIIIRVSYTESQAAGDVKVTKEYFYTEDLVKYSYNNEAVLNIAMDNCDELKDLVFTIAVVSDTGAENVSGQYVYADYK